MSGRSPAGLKWNSRAPERGVAGCRNGRHVHVMRFHPVAAVLIVATFDVGCADTQRPLAPSLAGAPSFSAGGTAACPTPATVVVTDEAGLDRERTRLKSQHPLNFYSVFFFKKKKKNID